MGNRKSLLFLQHPCAITEILEMVQLAGKRDLPDSCE